MFENDYILRQIEMMTGFLAKLIFGKESPEYELLFDGEENPLGEGELALKLRRMIELGEINEAENLLFDSIESEQKPEYLEIAIDFYDRLSKLDEAKLARCDFCLAEVLEGLENVKEKYGIETA